MPKTNFETLRTTDHMKTMQPLIYHPIEIRMSNNRSSKHERHTEMHS